MAKLAQEVGRTLPVIRGLEGGTDAEITLGTAARVAERLGLNLSDIVAEESVTPAREVQSEGEEQSMLAMRIEALLFSYGRELTVSTVAVALGVRTDQVTEAADLLADRCRDRGYHLVRHGAERMLLRPRETVLDRQAIRRLEKGMIARRGLSLQMGQVLYQILKAQGGSKRTYGIDTPGHRMALTSLMNADLVVTQQKTERPVLAEDVMFSLAPATAALREGDGGGCPRGPEAVAGVRGPAGAMRRESRPK
jgi:hypothetical protein